MRASAAWTTVVLQSTPSQEELLLADAELDRGSKAHENVF